MEQEVFKEIIDSIYTELSSESKTAADLRNVAINILDKNLPEDYTGEDRQTVKRLFTSAFNTGWEACLSGAVTRAIGRYFSEMDAAISGHGDEVGS